MKSILKTLLCVSCHITNNNYHRGSNGRIGKRGKGTLAEHTSLWLSLRLRLAEVSRKPVVIANPVTVSGNTTQRHANAACETHSTQPTLHRAALGCYGRLPTVWLQCGPQDFARPSDSSKPYGWLLLGNVVHWKTHDTRLSGRISRDFSPSNYPG